MQLRNKWPCAIAGCPNKAKLDGDICYKCYQHRNKSSGFYQPYNVDDYFAEKDRRELYAQRFAERDIPLKRNQAQPNPSTVKEEI